MAEKLKPDDKILLVQEESTEKNDLKVVKGMDKKGNLKTVDPDKAKDADFIQIDKSAEFLENFFKNFLKQAHKPKRMGVTHKFYVVSYSMLQAALKMTKEQLEKFRVKPEEIVNQQKTEPEKKQESESTNEQKTEQMEQKADQKEQRQEFKQFDVSRIPENEYQKLGIKPENLENELKAMSWGFKSPHLVDLVAKIGEEDFPLKARLSLAEQLDGSLKLVTYPFQNQVDVEKPFQGIILPKDVQENLLATGHTGRVVDLEPIQGKIVPSLISVDHITNRLEAVPVNSISISNIIKGAAITPEQQQGIQKGDKVLVQNMATRETIGTENPKLFDAYLQFNAAKGQLDFSYDGLNNKQGQEQSKDAKMPLYKVVDDIKIFSKQGGVQLSKEQFNELCKGKPVWIEDMQQRSKPIQQGAKQVEATDNKNQKYNAWVWPDKEAGKLRHTSKHPDDVKAKQSQSIKPAAGFETQVAVNNQGKTNEATKHTQEPLKKGQTKPTEQQEQKKIEKKKSKGVKM